MHRLLGLSDMKANTQWAPLALLGYRLQQRKFFEPLYPNLDLHQKQIRYTSQDKLITCLVSIMSDCQAISHIDTRIRPDRALAQAWGLECFAHQGYPFNAGQLEDGHRDLKCRKARPRLLRIQKPEVLMLQGVPPYVDTLDGQWYDRSRYFSANF